MELSLVGAFHQSTNMGSMSPEIFTVADYLHRLKGRPVEQIRRSLSQLHAIEGGNNLSCRYRCTENSRYMQLVKICLWLLFFGICTYFIGR